LKKQQNKIVFYAIKGSTIKKFIVFDLITGTGIYYFLKILFSSVIVATIGSIIVPEGIKKRDTNKIIKVKR